VTRTDTQAKPAFLAEETKVFAEFQLNRQARTLRLPEPAVALRVLEVRSGVPLVFLHGISLCSAHWAPLVSELDGVRSLLMDMPGHGDSDSVDYRGIDLRQWHAKMLSGCLDALGLDAVHLVGHSYGAMLGLWLALDAPDRVHSITAIGTPAVALGARPDLTLRMLSWPRVGPLALATPQPQFVFREILAMSLGKPAIDAAPPELIRATYLATRRRGAARTISSYLREQFQGARATPQRYVLQDDELRRINKPVLILWGERDNRYQPIPDARERAALIPESRFEVVPGGHEPWLEDPSRSAELISAFISENSQATTHMP
jgi:pimeloyl-ACP methyl ester carboxylesterase